MSSTDNNAAFRSASDDLVSIVVPVYNVESYVDDCLRSIEGQTYANIEIVIVDDGSTDRSSDICREHAQADSRIVYLRKSNGGLSSARNYGIQRATGQWTVYIDSDDMIDSRYVENLLRAAQTCGADLAVCGFSIVGKDSHAFRSRGSEVRRRGPSEAKEALSMLYSERYSCCAVWGKLARTTAWRRVQFPEGRRFEDFSRIDSLVEPGDSVVFLPWDGYAYRKSGSSITAASSVDLAGDLAESILELEEKLGTAKMLSRKSVSFKLCLESTRLVRMLDGPAGTRWGASSASAGLLRFARETIRRYWIIAMRDEEAPASQRIRIALFRWFPRVGAKMLKLATSGRVTAA